MGVDKVREWQKTEMSGLQELCRENEILFTTVHDHSIATKLVAGVVKEGTEEDVGLLQQDLAGLGDVSLVALRTSKTIVDFEHRLFNCSFLD